jgi:hypothetical protein
MIITCTSTLYIMLALKKIRRPMLHIRTVSKCQLHRACNRKVEYEMAHLKWMVPNMTECDYRARSAGDNGCRVERDFVRVEYGLRERDDDGKTDNSRRIIYSATVKSICRTSRTKTWFGRARDEIIIEKYRYMVDYARGTILITVSFESCG